MIRTPCQFKSVASAKLCPSRDLRRAECIECKESEDGAKHWMILTRDGIFTRGKFHGTTNEALEHCESLYKGEGYKLVKDNRNYFYQQ